MKNTTFRRVGLIALGFLLAIIAVQVVVGNAASPPASKTGAPGENKCLQCHGGTAGTGTVSMVFGNNETQYVPGQVYTITTSTQDPTKVRFGFQITALAGGVGASVGTFAVTNTTNTTTEIGNVGGFLRKYVSHKSANTNQNWSFEWTAPSTDIGPITFFLVGVAANNNNSDAGDKVYSATMTISAVPPPPPVAAVTVTDTSTCVNSAVTFTDASTNSPSSHQWLFPGGNPSASTDANPTIIYSTSGFYDVSLITGNVTGSDTIVLTNYIHVYDLPALSGLPDATSCAGGSDGSVNLTVTGAGGYTFLWSTGATVEDVSGLGAGTVSVTVTDQNGCSSTSTFTISEPTQISLSFTSQPAGCGASNGSATVTGSGGVGGYTYLWSNGNTTATATSLAAGSHTVTVTDANGCSLVGTVAVSNIGAPTGSTLVTNPSCNGDQNGAVDLTVSGGVGPFTYQWSNGASTEDISGLPAGTYTVTVTSFDGCNLSQVVTLTEPAALALAVSNTPEMSGLDGTATVTPTGGNGGYTYLWSNGGTTQTITGLAAGTYTVTVTDSQGCNEITSVNVSLVISVAGTMHQDLFTVGPNPFHEYFTLSPNVTVYGSFVVHLIDINGRIVFGTTVDSKGAAPVRITPGPMNDGVYILMIQTAKGKMIKKVIHSEY